MNGPTVIAVISQVIDNIEKAGYNADLAREALTHLNQINLTGHINPAIITLTTNHPLHHQTAAAATALKQHTKTQPPNPHHETAEALLWAQTAKLTIQTQTPKP
jgi:hypothetical protein